MIGTKARQGAAHAIAVSYKNRLKQPVTVDLSTDGDYSAIKRVL